MTDTENQTAPAVNVPAAETFEPAPETPKNAMEPETPTQPEGQGEDREDEGGKRPSRSQRRIALLTRRGRRPAQSKRGCASASGCRRMAGAGKAAAGVRPQG